ncbi:hypothetical protein OSTOST_20766 [Ostertagia ostertagi]
MKFLQLDPMQMASELMSAAAKAENRRKTISGINLPLPFAGKPLNFQMTGESRNGLSFTESDVKPDERQSDLSLARLERLFITAKRISPGICPRVLCGTAEVVFQALDTFHRLKFGESLVNVDPVRGALDDDPTTSFAKMLVPALEEKLEAPEKDPHAGSSVRKIQPMPITKKNR